MSEGTDRWRWVPLLSAVAIYTAAAFTFGLGFLLFPAALFLTVLARRRTSSPRGLVFWLGTLAVGVVSAAGVGALVVVLLAVGH